MKESEMNKMNDEFKLFFLSLCLVSVLFAQDEKLKTQTDEKVKPD